MHSLIRTSRTGPGQTFIGKCMYCGKEGLTIAQALEDCEESDKHEFSDTLRSILEME